MPDATQSGLSDNSAAAIAYITFVPAIVFLATPPYNQSPNIRFHSWQSIFLTCAAVAFWIVFTILRILVALVLPFGLGFLMLFVSLACWLGWFLIWLYCVINAMNGKPVSLPIIGQLAAKQAGR
jgi:uncharacterized membrane protein